MNHPWNIYRACSDEQNELPKGKIFDKLHEERKTILQTKVVIPESSSSNSISQIIEVTLLTLPLWSKKKWYCKASSADNINFCDFAYCQCSGIMILFLMAFTHSHPQLKSKWNLTSICSIYFYSCLVLVCVKAFQYTNS